MEPRGCDRWQSLANRIGGERRKEAKNVAMDCDRCLEVFALFHGSELVEPQHEFLDLG